MSCHSRSVYISLCFFALVFLVQCSAKVTERKCFSTELEQCWVGETCEIQVQAGQGGSHDGVCVCLGGHQRNEEGYCIPIKPHPSLPTPAKVNSDTKSSSASIAAGVLVPLLLIGLAALFVLGRRYGWWQRLRQPRIRQYDTALVGGDLDDDPPIA
ncbi:Scavenger receptor cysteine-rich type 1 protein M130 [Frankliniella fusca]|uniref:Scavenger receptor cysteine-rich type 1 protein M130 n=1 Tax=Frankliniella fusca TaxID=407009 RepID=A0AAE1LDE0_9NEOP|nr:Scavenger receptor cysteine-rich type 1 protein M130 [Frankliniella fusca]